MAVRRTRLPTEKHDVGPVRLYREDLQAIASAVGELGVLKITCDSAEDAWEASDSSEFCDFPIDLLEVTISSNDEDTSAAVTATFNTTTSLIELTDPDIFSEGILSRIRTICGNRRRPLWYLRRRGSTLAFAGFLALIVLVPIEADSNLSNNYFFGTVFPVFVLSLIPIGLAIRWLGSSRKAIITNAPRATKPSYWERTGDMWVVGVITAIVGAILGYMLGKFS